MLKGIILINKKVVKNVHVSSCSDSQASILMTHQITEGDEGWAEGRWNGCGRADGWRVWPRSVSEQMVILIGAIILDRTRNS